MEIESGESRLLTEAGKLEAASLTLLPDDRSFLFLDGRRLEQSGANGSGNRTLYELPEGVRYGGSVRVSDDGHRAYFATAAGESWQVQELDLKRQRVRMIIESPRKIIEPLPRPRKRELAFRQDGEVWLVTSSGKRPSQVPAPPGLAGPAEWSADGRALLYLLIPEEKSKLHEIREYFVDNRQDRPIAKTSQFVSFGSNSNSSVFVGASGGRATPFVLLLLRVNGRELSICEHRASNPAMVQPAFSPDSRRIFFQSDRDGKPAIYSMVVDKLVEATEREQ